MNAFTLYFYRKRDNTVPVQEFIESLSPKLQAKTLGDLLLLRQQGYALRAPKSKSLQNGIFELRTQVSSDTTRILYFFFDGQNIILTNGFIKKTQKTPREEIEKAIAYRADFLSGEE